jgi:hypothetical protein
MSLPLESGAILSRGLAVGQLKHLWKAFALNGLPGMPLAVEGR